MTVNPVAPDPITASDLQALLVQHALFLSTQGAEGTPLDLSYYRIEDFDFSHLKLGEAPVQGSILINCRFTHTDLSGANFSETIAQGADFRGAILVKTEFYRVSIKGACFEQANLTRAELVQSDLSDCNFRAAVLRGAQISECILTGAHFQEADLTHASLDKNQGEGYLPQG